MIINLVGLTREQKLATIKSIQDNGLYHNGSYINIEYATPKKVLQAYEKVNGTTTILKTTRALVRLGIEYSNTNHFQSLNRELNPLKSPFDRHLQGYESLLIETTKENQPNDYKLICFTTNHKPHSVWTMDGKVVEKESLKGIISKSEFVPSEPMPTYYIKLDNLLSIELAN